MSTSKKLITATSSLGAQGRILYVGANDRSTYNDNSVFAIGSDSGSGYLAFPMEVDGFLGSQVIVCEVGADLGSIGWTKYFGEGRTESPFTYHDAYQIDTAPDGSALVLHTNVVLGAIGVSGIWAIDDTGALIAAKYASESSTTAWNVYRFTVTSDTIFMAGTRTLNTSEFPDAWGGSFTHALAENWTKFQDRGNSWTTTSDYAVTGTDVIEHGEVNDNYTLIISRAQSTGAANWITALNVSGTNPINAHGVEVLSDGSIVTVFTRDNETYIAKLNSSGVYQSGYKITYTGAVSTPYGFRENIVVDEDDNIYLSGIAYTPNTFSLLKLNSSFALQWSVDITGMTALGSSNEKLSYRDGYVYFSLAAEPGGAFSTYRCAAAIAISVNGIDDGTHDQFTFTNDIASIASEAGITSTSTTDVGSTLSVFVTDTITSGNIIPIAEALTIY